MVYGLFRALPGDRAFLPPSPAKIASRELDASVGASGPHAFAVRQPHRPSSAHPASTASRSAFRDVAQRPSKERDGDRYKVICVFGKPEYFFERGWTEGSTNCQVICPSGRIGCAGWVEPFAKPIDAAKGNRWVSLR